jgi:hypothetical protein
MRWPAGLGAVDVFFDLQVEGQLDVEPIAFGGPDQRPATRFRAAQMHLASLSSS